MNPRIQRFLQRMLNADVPVVSQAAPMPVRQMELPFDGLPAVVNRGTVPEDPFPPSRAFAYDSLDSLDVPPAPPQTPDFSLDSPLFRQMHTADRAYDNLRRGRSANLWNQPFNAPAGAAIRDAAADAIRALQRDAQMEQLGRIAALAGVGGLGGMIAASDANLRGPAELASMAETPVPQVIAVEPSLEDIVASMPDVAMEDNYEPVVADMPMPSQPDMPMPDSFSTADLVAESRPLPASTPRLTAEEIDALRSQVVDIRDAATGQAMDSFYPPESEEYKAEQRAKKRYPQLRMR